MNGIARLGIILSLGLVTILVAGPRLLGGGDEVDQYVRSLEKRPYTERNLAEEYGLKPAGPRRGGALDYMSVATDANKRNHCLEAEASRIRIEFGEKVGPVGALFHSIDADRIARNRFEDQGLVPQAATK